MKILTMIKRADLISPELFGNEAGEDEDPQILASYFVDKPEFENFYSARFHFRIVKSKKGVGKSALLTRACEIKRAAKHNEIVLYLKGADLVAIQKLDDVSPNSLINGWQQRICSRINQEIGAHLNWAFRDASITLVESAELSGFKDRNLLGALVDRIKIKASPADSKKLQEANSAALLERFASENAPTVWLFIDDIDATFINTETQRLTLSTFFTACRYLSNSVKGLRIRASVRTDVWTILAQHDEALDKCEQYMTDLSWSNSEAEQILIRKIISYFSRTYSDDPRFIKLQATLDSVAIQRLIFAPVFPWRRTAFPPDRPIYILSNGRPRWATHLCKLAGKHAYDLGANVISIHHIGESLKKFGEARLNDLYKEHRHQYKKLEDLIESFARGASRYTTHQLLKHIMDRVIRKQGLPEIDGIQKTGGAVDLAHFLYRIGFICGRDDGERGGLSFVRYEQRPNLLTTAQNLDDGLIWEVHPSFRDVLRIGR